jgi:hypothetical protein
MPIYFLRSTASFLILLTLRLAIIKNVTPSDVYYGRQEQILQKRALIKQQSLKRRKQLFLKEKIIHLNNETLYT